jgi:hypothetical protein
MLIGPKSLWQWHVNTIIDLLDIMHWLVFLYVYIYVFHSCIYTRTCIYSCLISDFILR